MTSIKVKFRPSTIADREGTIYYQIIHERKVRQLLTEYRVFPYEWDGNRSMVTTHQDSERKLLIHSIRERIRWDIERLTKIEHKLSCEALSYSVCDIIEEFRRYTREYSLFNYMERNIARLKQIGKVRTAETYKSTLNSFKRYRNDEDIMLDSITSELIEDYDAWQKNRGVTTNTISFYNRILRAVYNRAVEDEIIENHYPFRRVYTGVDKTIKRALPLTIIKKIKTLDLTLTPSLDYARDMFMMSFYLRGMSFIDMAFLKKSDLKNGYITYRRCKTGQQLIIEWTKEMQMLLDKYPENKSNYLLPIIRNPGTNERCVYHNVGYNINHNLKQIAKAVNIDTPLTLYVARHSWASAARAKGVPISVISEGLGHDNETTTQIYLASIGTSVVDKANSLILKAL